MPKKKWYTPERMKASKKNIKKATKAWDEMSYSVAEGNIPKTLRVKNESYRLYETYKDKKFADAIAKDFRGDGINARLKPITIGGTSFRGKHVRKRTVYAVYTGGRKKKAEKRHAPALYPREKRVAVWRKR